MEVHRCRFIEYQPAAINALDFTPSTCKQSRLAVGRANGNIEIWDPMHRFRLEKTIPGGQDLSVESLVWAHQSVVIDQDEDDDPEDRAKELQRQLDQPPRLFSTGLNPFIIEWDLTSLTAKKSVDSNGGAIWCLAVNSNGTQLAAGCEDGCIRLFNIADDSLEYIRRFDPQKGRILSVAWGPNDEYIVSGGSDSALRKWDVATGRVIQRMTVDKLRKVATLVWSVVVTANNTIISGDSLGNLMFWDAEQGTMKQSFRAHGADILSVVASKDGRLVFSAGVDRKLNAFRCVQQNKHSDTSGSNKGGNWVNMGSRRYHSHDIRALALDERPAINSIVSGGVDLELISSPALEFPKLIQNRLPPFPQKYLASVSKSRRLILSMDFNSVSLWRLGRAGQLDMSSTRSVTIPEMLEPHQLELQVKLKPECNITSSALSEDAQWIAVSDVENVRLFKLHETESKEFVAKKERAFQQSLQRYLADKGAAAGAHHVVFTPGSDKLIVVTSESRILIVDLTSFEVLHEFEHHRGVDGDDAQVGTVISVAVSADGQWLATGDDLNRMCVFNLDTLKHHFNLPQTSTPHTTLSFHDLRSNDLFVGLASNEFYIYDVERKRLNNWSKQHQDQTNSRLRKERDRIRGVMYNPADANCMIIYGSTYICMVDMHDRQKGKSEGKALKRKADQEDKAPTYESAAMTLWISGKYQHILHCDFLSTNCMVMIERTKFSVLEKLPPSYYKPQFAS
ncbi:quinon protein alcohol dehydrogenase-like superfamily [Radiomyces spectabilis]|uniref:quinon protein alcohol dehydrogenase-like superfamily n=1 Tax=Radiomyces spectabilis TaxID=64574 RepID=UPI002220B78E|nr:quinon protein alcohol dehydrogenase-like superfamily [Radiomyces spectabilis]KAI8381572.1 quinon protein alcohol dehydrogenase-like superfamily [Radiomyces spectabilis]